MQPSYRLDILESVGHVERVNSVGALSHVPTHEYVHASIHVALSQLGHVAILYHYLDNLQGTRGNILPGPFVPLNGLHPLDSLKSSLICETLVS